MIYNFFIIAFIIRAIIPYLYLIYQLLFTQ